MLNPSYYGYVDIWLKEMNEKKHSRACAYIEKNVDLIDEDLQKFIDNCPQYCLQVVCEMLIKAGIDIKGYNRNSIKQQKIANYILDEVRWDEVRWDDEL